MLITHKIENTHFSSSEKLIIQFILEQEKNIEYMSMQDIAKATFTSAPLLSRIAKKLGFNGWNSFKEAYIEELNYLYNDVEVDASIPFVVSDNYQIIAENIIKLQMESLQDTLALLKHDDLYKAMRYLRNAEEIDIYGVGDYLYIAQQFASQMFYINKKVNICHLSGESKARAILSKKNHCALLISYSGETRFIKEIAAILKEKEVPIIAMTCISDNSLTQFSDCTLKISSREMLHTKIGDFSSTQSIKTLLDILYGCIFSLDYQNNLDTKIALANEIDDKKSGYEYIDEK